MEKAYRFRLYPYEKQRIQFHKTFGCCRWLHNHFVADRKDSYEHTGGSPGMYEQMRGIAVLKKDPDTAFLKEVDNTALRNATKHVDAAYQNFFRRVKAGETPGHPRFRRKHDHRQSYTATCNYHQHRSGEKVGTIRVENDRVLLPKVGLVKCRVSKQIHGRILSATVSQEPSGKYHVSIPNFPN